MHHEHNYDCGFEESDTMFLFVSEDDKKIQLRKNRHWFDVEGEMDFDISYSIVVDGNVFITFPKEVSRSTAVEFASQHFGIDEESTEELQSMYAEMEAERNRGA